MYLQHTVEHKLNAVIEHFSANTVNILMCNILVVPLFYPNYAAPKRKTTNLEELYMDVTSLLLHFDYVLMLKTTKPLTHILDNSFLHFSAKKIHQILCVLLVR